MDRSMLCYIHVNEVNKKVMEILLYLNRIGYDFDKLTRTIVIQSLVLSLINYCIRIWGTTSETLMNNV